MTTTTTSLVCCCCCQNKNPPPPQQHKAIPGTVGVQGDQNKDGSTTVEECPVQFVGSLAHRACGNCFDGDVDDNNSIDNNRCCRYHDKVQVFRFDQFQVVNVNHDVNNHNVTSKICLKDYMDQIKSKLRVIEQNQDEHDNVLDDDDKEEENAYLDPQDRILAAMHDAFLPIVQDILDQHGFFTSLTHNHSNIQIQKYSRPNYRQVDNQYANYLHNDTWIQSLDPDNDDSNQRLAMVNIWFVLNNTPPSNTLVFLETLAGHTRQSHMLHASMEHCRDQRVHYDADMAWGRFYLFVSGQMTTENSDQRVLLHGAATVPQEGASSLLRGEVRQSIEMRYTLHNLPSRTE
jgi:hypothetical protein